MTDPIAVGAHAAAIRLTPEYGPGLAADVEDALDALGMEQRPERYLDPVSLGALIVSIAGLAWTIYTDQRKKTAEPSADVVARHVHAELRQHSDTSQHDTERITEIVITEIIQAVRADADLSFGGSLSAEEAGQPPGDPGSDTP
jgi:uncharacterized membrane protein YebE (DUF533 family)